MTKAEKQEQDFGLNAEEMAKQGMHLGHKTSRINPKMKPFLVGTRNDVHVIDLDQTLIKLKQALEFIQSLIASGKTLLLVGTKVQVKNLVKEVALECNLPYVNERWLGGTFTNFETLKKRIEYFKDLENKKAAGELEKYTKKEQLMFDREINTLETKFGGIKNMNQLPDAVFVMDMRKDILPVKEAKLKGIKIIGVADTNVDPNLADYPIPANDDAAPSIKYILDKVKEVILKLKK